MKVLLRLLLLAFVSSAVAAVLPGRAGAVYDPDSEPRQPRMVAGRVTIEFDDGVDLTAPPVKAFGRVSFGLPSLDALLADLRVGDARKIFPWVQERPKAVSEMRDLTRFYELSFPEETDIRDIMSSLRQNPNIRLVEPVWEMPLLAAPNDPSWANQWAMEPPAPDPYYYDAWDIETGSDAVIFGCVDSGVNYKHADLAPNVWVNPGEDVDGDGVVYDTDDLNGVDNDGNGVVDDLIGYDFFSYASPVAPGEDGSVRDTDPNDFNGHGTHVAGIVAAATNNGVNVTGVAGGWYGGHRSYRGARIMCLRAGYEDPDGNGWINGNDAAAAISYAVMMGADVINASYGGSAITAAAAHNAIQAGVTFTHAAGNDNTYSGDELDWVNGMLSVASVGPYSDVKSGFSNYGDWVDVSAPGSSILSTFSDAYAPTTATLGGTSMAAPMVAGLAVLIRSAMPSLTKQQVDSIIINTADSIDAVNDPMYAGMLGSGRINAHRALMALGSAKVGADVTDGNVPLTVNFVDQSPYVPTSWLWSFGTGDQSTDQNPTYVYTEPGVYDVSLEVDDTATIGPGEERLSRYVWARADTLKIDSVTAYAGDTVTFPIYLRNTAQISDIIFAFQLQNHDAQDVHYVDHSVVGLRTDYFASVTKIAEDPTNQRFAIRLRSNTTSGSTYLTPDTGAILNIRLAVEYTVAPGTVVTFDTLTVSGIKPRVTTPHGTYWPIFTPGKLVVLMCDHGDANCDGQIKVSDLVFLAAYIFRSGARPDPGGGDVDGNGYIGVNDITYLVNYLFKFGPPPPAE